MDFEALVPAIVRIVLDASREVHACALRKVLRVGATYPGEPVRSRQRWGKIFFCW